MKRHSLGIFAAVLLLTGLAPADFAQTTEEILGKMVDALGGAEALAAIHDATVSSSIELIQMGLSGNMTMYKKEPDKIRMDIEVMGMTISQGYDGAKAWMTNPQTGATEEMPEKYAAYFKRQAMGNDSILHPEKYGISYAFKGKEKIDGKDYLVLEQGFSDGHVSSLYLDAATYLLYKSKSLTLNQAGNEVPAETFASDYRKAGDMNVAHAMTVLENGAESMKITVLSVVYNSGLEDSRFAAK
ncbi:MAG TPA: hypothetical protein PLX50_00990 [Candidatus Aminicenantes bacterium]|nr:hypothetical protein [Candidatus Aminicenantes bacterium]